MSISKKPQRMRLLASVAATCLVCATGFAAHAQSAKQFYSGKSLRFIIPAGAGGGYDSYYRLFARHVSEHIPGHPRIIDENMPGAAGMRATNWLYTAAPKDGTVLGSTFNTLLTEPLLGDTQTQYDPTKFEWIGSLNTQYNACTVWHSSPIKTIQDAMKQQVLVSTTGFAGNTAKTPLMLNKLIGTKFKLIAGYSTTGMRLAVERGEVQGVCGLSYDTFQVANPEWLKDHKVRFIIQTGPRKIKELPNVPLLINFVHDPKQRAALKVLDVGQDVGRPIMFPPGTPKYLVDALRTAFVATMKDHAFLADAHRMRIDPHWMSGAASEKEIQEAYKTPKDVVELTAELWPPATHAASADKSAAKPAK